ncbi:hypothetical protein NUU61_004440 [Penicillium alfredii]|uniref:Uncharacterized protein n=1 Tax=Penicillium alfredii TaxID=1506179 RepID=A0A9W9FL58_9EURO|nr:uncharacterized protein NUU61_004440 [Penicillium alfredii]KAJ5102218.1 hypothetical protein NUU61_004440 [Penicillium alfredii]
MFRGLSSVSEVNVHIGTTLQLFVPRELRNFEAFSHIDEVAQNFAGHHAQLATHLALGIFVQTT